MKKIRFILLFALLASISSAFITREDPSPCDGVQLYGNDVQAGFVPITPTTQFACPAGTDFCKYYKDGEVYRPCPEPENANKQFTLIH